MAFEKCINGIPVWNSELKVLIDKDGKIKFISTNFTDFKASNLKPILLVNEAINTAIQIKLLDQFKTEDTKLVFYTKKETTQLVLCWYLKIRSNKDTFIFMINAENGDVELCVDAYPDISTISGSVEAMVYSEPIDSPPDNLPILTVPLADLSVRIEYGISELEDYTDNSGNYSFANPPYDIYTLNATLNGHYHKVINVYDMGDQTSHSATVYIGTPHSWIWNETNHYGQHNTYYYMNEIRSFFLDNIPDFNSNYFYNHNMEALVNYTIFDDPSQYTYPWGKAVGDKILLGKYGSRYAGVIYHEYSHNILYKANGNWIGYDDLIYEDGGAIDEGFADYFTCAQKNYHKPLQFDPRVLNDHKKYTYPPYDPHFRGPIIGGACWDLRTSLGGDFVDNLVYELFTTYLSHGSTFGDFMDYLLEADDNDDNIMNGTPHAQQIFSAFNENHYILGNYVSGTLYRDFTWDNSKIILGDITIQQGTTLTIEDGAELNFAQIDLTSGGSNTNLPEFIVNGKLIINDDLTLDKCLTINSGAEIEIGPNSSLQLNGGLIINGDVNFSCSTNSSLTISSPIILNSGTDIVFGDNTIINFQDHLTLNAGSSCTFGELSEVNFYDNVYLYGSFVFGEYSTISYYDFAYFYGTSHCTYMPHTTVYYIVGSRHEGNAELQVDSHASFGAPALFSAGANYSLGADASASFADVCVIDSAATVYIDHGNASFSDSLLVYGQLWIDNCTMDFGDDTTKAQGIIFEGGGASLSRITDSIVRDCMDGITIINSSPLIKTSEFMNMEKRGFNIIGIDAEPEIRQCYIHLTGTYPLQMLSEADPTLVDNRFYGNGKCGARIWGADGVFTRNEFRSQTESGVFMFSSTSAPQFYSFADSGGNMFDMSQIATQAVFIGGGSPLLGDYPNITGNNIFKNRGSRYYIYNDTPGNIIAELSWWANGTGTGSYYNADGGNVDFSPKLDVEPPAGPLLLKAAASPFTAGFEKYQRKDYAGAMQDLKQMLQQDKTSSKADQAVFRMGKAARKIGRLGELEAFLGDLKKERDPQIQYHSRNWLCYLYASRNDMKNAEKLLDEVPKGSSYERTMLLDICSYYASLKDMKNAERIAGILRERHNNDVLEMELEAALEGWIDFTQVKGQTKARRRGASIPLPQPYIAEQTAAPVPADTVALKAGIYPNPFNSSTTINYSVAQDGPVQIAIYDLLGRRVQTLVDERRVAGSYRAVWNGCDKTGRSVASGIYFVRMQVGGKAQSFKISYVK
ncbi:MAG TPA: T9SS type A sorting domain-containing protein [bacterium]|nr:T9SS type A sorting domain-containing protein [bacterium]HPN45995.1 T9SS type A sorting domain-containing protein [bacterium]